MATFFGARNSEIWVYLAIRPVALEGEGSNCFSITKLVGQTKAIIKLENAS